MNKNVKTRTGFANVKYQPTDDMVVLMGEKGAMPGATTGRIVYKRSRI